MASRWTERTTMIPMRISSDANRLRFDFKDLPDGFVPKLRGMALELGYDRFNEFILDVLKHAAKYNGDE